MAGSLSCRGCGAVRCSAMLLPAARALRRRTLQWQMSQSQNTESTARCAHACRYHTPSPPTCAVPSAIYSRRSTRVRGREGETNTGTHAHARARTHTHAHARIHIHAHTECGAEISPGEQVSNTRLLRQDCKRTLARLTREATAADSAVADTTVYATHCS